MYQVILIIALLSSTKAIAWGISCCAKAKGIVDDAVDGVKHAGGEVSHGVKHSVAVVSDGVTHSIEVLGSESQTAIRAVNHPEEIVGQAVTVVKEIGGESIEILIRARESLNDAIHRLEKGLQHLSTETFRQYQALESEIGRVDIKSLNMRQSIDRMQREITDFPDFKNADYIPTISFEGISFPDLASANIPSFNEIIEGSHYHADEIIDGSHYYGKKVVEGAHYYGNKLLIDGETCPDYKYPCSAYQVKSCDDTDISDALKLQCLTDENKALSQEIDRIKSATDQEVALAERSIANKIAKLRAEMSGLRGAGHE